MVTRDYEASRIPLSTSATEAGAVVSSRDDEARVIASRSSSLPARSRTRTHYGVYPPLCRSIQGPPPHKAVFQSGPAIAGS